jgi:hypothetical protein
MSNLEAKKLILDCFDFIVGNTEYYHDTTELTRFIDKRSAVGGSASLSRVVDLLQMREFHAVVNSRYSKRELVEFFCNLQPFERKRLLTECSDTIVSIPYDFKLFKLERPPHIAYRCANFSGKTVEYPVFSILSFLKLFKQEQDYQSRYQKIKSSH